MLLLFEVASSLLHIETTSTVVLVAQSSSMYLSLVPLCLKTALKDIINCLLARWASNSLYSKNYAWHSKYIFKIRPQNHNQIAIFTIASSLISPEARTPHFTRSDHRLSRFDSQDAHFTFYSIGLCYPLRKKTKLKVIVSKNRPILI